MILSGVRVVELAAWVAGPAAGGVLADWGADVVKVEPPAGDPQRGVFSAIGANEQTAVPPFEVDNRGKRSVVLDLRSEAGSQRWNGSSGGPTSSSPTPGWRRSNASGSIIVRCGGGTRT